MTIDSFGAMADRQHHSAGSDNRVGVQLGFETFEILFAVGAADLIPCVVIKEQYFGSMVVMDLLSKTYKAIQHGQRNPSLLQAGSGVVCNL
jgi:hypothetical protein